MKIEFVNHERFFIRATYRALVDITVSVIKNTMCTFDTRTVSIPTGPQILISENLYEWHRTRVHVLV